MTASSLHPALKKLCDALETLAKQVREGWSGDVTFQQQWGWNCLPVTRHSLANAASRLAGVVRSTAADTLDQDLVQVITQAQASVELLRNQTVQYMYNGNANAAVPVYLQTLDRIREDLDPVIGWQRIADSNLVPAKIVRRVRAYQATLDEIAPDRDELVKQISLIREATAAADSLPVDLESLRDARKKVASLQDATVASATKIGEYLTQSETLSKAIAARETEATKLVSQCEQAYRITTTKGLAAAFDKRARELSDSMWVWVLGLIGALSAGYFLGGQRLKALVDVLNSASQQGGAVWVNAVLVFLSLGAPIWFAWLATKQIGQRFRLAEDYAFKASVAKSYEGYRKEAARIDEDFEARLFGSALTRLEEAPLRLVEAKSHGSPWHEFLESEAVRSAIRSIPGFRETLERFGKTDGKCVATSASAAEAANRSAASPN